MKMLKTLVGLAAIGGAYAYAKKNGGVRATFDRLMRKKDELLKKADENSASDRVTPHGTEPLFPDIPPMGQRP